MRRDRRHIINEYLFCKDKKKNGNTYYRCTFFFLLDVKHGSPSTRTTTSSPTPDHNHETQVAETHVHVVKQDLKRKVPTSDLPTKYLVAEDCRPLFDHTK